MMMTVQRLAGIVLLVGSVIFLIAAFAPISWVYAERVVEKKLAMISANPESWKLTHLLFGIGAVMVAVGYFVAYLALRERDAGVASLLSFGMIFFGALLWAWHLALRVADPTAFFYGQLSPARLLFAGYTGLTLAGLFTFGIALLQAGFPTWSGWFNIGATVLFALLLALFGDLPPFSYYVIALTNATLLLVKQTVRLLPASG